MSTTQRWSRMLRAATVCTVAGAVLTAGHLAAATAAAPPVSPALAADIDAGSTVAAAASALLPAKRLSIDPTKPIFPMQTEPTCVILDNFGDARSGGRSHEGTDILADSKVGPTQAVYAVVDGTLGRQVIDGQSGSSLSGNAWRLTATGSRTYYVFMHLSSFAPGLANGSVVTQGQLIGYVGDTGNPGPGNYHLHFEYHPATAGQTGTEIPAVNPLTVLPKPAACTVY